MPPTNVNDPPRTTDHASALEPEVLPETLTTDPVVPPIVIDAPPSDDLPATLLTANFESEAPKGHIDRLVGVEAEDLWGQPQAAFFPAEVLGQRPFYGDDADRPSIRTEPLRTGGKAVGVLAVDEMTQHVHRAECPFAVAAG